MCIFLQYNYTNDEFIKPIKSDVLFTSDSSGQLTTLPIK